MTTITTAQPSPIHFNSENINNMKYDRHRHHTQRVGNYVIYKKTLGSGSMGTVKLAECLSDNDHQLYAVKIMPKINLTSVSTTEDSSNKDPKDTPKEKEQRTIREMAIMHLLRHPNICQLKEWITEGEQYYMFLEYIEGGQLLDYIISNGKLREKLARKFARQIVSALDYCHRNSIVHRDLKIENILITTTEDIKIIDFGLSNIYSPNRLLDTFCGSLYFAAPELLQAKNYTGPEVDVWSFGVVLYVLVCGRVPFDDTSLPALHKKIREGHVEYPDHLSKDCVDLLSKILVVEPQKRETLSFVIHHPWINKGYDEPIFNHLPHRTPLTSIDPQIISGMQGFGLGTPEEIESKLLRIISSPAYQYAAAQVDLVQQQQQSNASPSSSLNTTTATMTRWRRTLSLRKSSVHQHHKKKKDDPQSLPVMYDPLVSIYCLVKERRELDEKNRLLESEGYRSPVQLGRSASTSLAKSSVAREHHLPNNSTRTSNAHLQRRKTERVRPSYRHDILKQHVVSSSDSQQQQQHVINDWAAPRTPESASYNSINKPSSTTLLQRSRSAAKRLGSMLPHSNNSSHVASSSMFKASMGIDTNEEGRSRPAEENDRTTYYDATVLGGSLSLMKPRSSSTVAVQSSRPNSSHDDSTTSYFKKKTMNLLRSSSLSDKHHRQQRQHPLTATIQNDSRVFIEKAHENLQQIPKTSTHPKSLFNFNHRHLFKVSTKDMMRYVQQVMLKIGIRYFVPYPKEQPFTLRCELWDWPRYKKFEIVNEVEEFFESCPTTETRFTLIVYQARWARGRLGIKVLEAEEEHINKSLYRRIYYTILNELGLQIKCQ